MGLQYLGAPAVIMAFQWDWYYLIGIVLLAAIVAGAIFFSSTETGKALLEEQMGKGPRKS